MVIRGAPAIGVAAAMGIALGMRRASEGHRAVRRRVPEDLRHDGRHAADRGQSVLGDRSHEARLRRRRRRRASRSTRLTTRLDREAHSDSRRGRRELPRDGRHSAPRWCRDGARILTHCNAGALATAGYGTALGVIRAAVEQGKNVAVFADETRPFLQGARLTAWELVRDGINTTVITESMAGPLMRAGEIDLVVVGADRIAANGDIANKIGTYTVAVLAKEHNIPFYVAAPLSTIDLSTPDGDHIPIEERDAAGGHASRLDAADARRRARSVIPRSTSRRIATSPASSPSAASSVRPTPRSLRDAFARSRQRTA